jgi:hypothetical protein
VSSNLTRALDERVLKPLEAAVDDVTATKLEVFLFAVLVIMIYFT